jgi:hypothetical protein
MARYVRGDFSKFTKEERMVAMQFHCKKLQTMLLDDHCPDWGEINDEIDDLVKKLTVGKSAVVFDKDVFFVLMRKYNSDEAYRAEIASKINGTYVKPPKVKTPKAPPVAVE